MNNILIIFVILLFLPGLPWLLPAKPGLGNLPGDIRFERKGFTFYFPITSGIVGSLLVTLIFRIFQR